MTTCRLPARRAVESGPRLRRRKVRLSEDQLSRPPHLRACFASDRQGALRHSLPPGLSVQRTRESDDRPDVRRFAPMECVAWFAGAVAQLGHPCGPIRFRIWNVCPSCNAPRVRTHCCNSNILYREAYPNIRTVDYWTDGDVTERYPQSRYVSVISDGPTSRTATAAIGRLRITTKRLGSSAASSFISWKTSDILSTWRGLISGFARRKACLRYLE